MKRYLYQIYINILIFGIYKEKNYRQLKSKQKNRSRHFGEKAREIISKQMTRKKDSSISNTLFF